MEYIYTITTTDANGNQTTTEYTINATDARTAHNAAEINKPHGAKVSVYPSLTTTIGVMRGAVMVARVTARNAVKRQGTETQHRMEREYAAINARLVGAETPERINTVIKDYSHDSQDFYDVALFGLYEAMAAGLNISECYHAAYLTLNIYIASQRKATDHEMSTEFIRDGGGDLVGWNTAVASIIRGSDKWIPTAGSGMDATTAARLGVAIADAMRIVSPTQRQIAELLAKGYSQRQIAEKTKRAVTTVEENIAIMRGKIAEYIRENHPDFAYIIGNHNGESTIRIAATAAAAKTWTNGGRTEEGAARHNAIKKANNAEYCKAYRMRKALMKKWREWMYSIDTANYIDDIDGILSMVMIQDFANHVGIDLLDREKGKILFDIARTWDITCETIIMGNIEIERAWRMRGESNMEQSPEWDEYQKNTEWLIENARLYGGADGIERITTVLAAK